MRRTTASNSRPCLGQETEYTLSGFTVKSGKETRRSSFAARSFNLTSRRIRKETARSLGLTLSARSSIPCLRQLTLFRTEASQIVYPV